MSLLSSLSTLSKTINVEFVMSTPAETSTAAVTLTTTTATTTTTTNTNATTSMAPPPPPSTTSSGGEAANAADDGEIRAKLEALRAQYNNIASNKKNAPSNEKRRGVMAKRRANDILATQGLLRDMLEYNGGCAHVETLVKSIEEYNVQQRTPLALEEPNWAKFVRECLVASDLPDGENGFKERSPNYWAVADDDIGLTDVFEPLFQCITRGTQALGKNTSMDALYKFVNEQWNPKPLRDREEPTADELRHSIGLTLTTDPAFTNSVASREWLRVQTTDVGDLAAAQSVVVRNNSGRVSRAAALAAADAIVSGVPPSFVLPPSDTVAIARSASATDLVVSPRPGLLSPSSTAAVVATTSAASSSARGGRRRTADGMSNGVGASHSVSSHQQQNNSHQHNNTDDHSGSNAAPRKRHKLPQPEYGHVCKCGATRPAEGSRSKWKLLDAIGDFVCHACYASDETVCPLCQTQYYEDENDPWICCERCDRWVHARCDQITDISLFDDSNPRRLVYLCALCREKAGADDEAAAAVTASIAAAAAAAAAAHATTSTVASDAVDHAGHKRGRGAIKREADPSHSPGAAATAATSSAATTTAATTTGVATAVTTTSTGEERKRGSGRRRKSQTPPSNLQALVAPLQPSVALDRIETKLWSELDADQPVVALAADRAGAALTNLEVAFAEAVHTQKLQLQRELNQRDAAADEAFQAAVAEASRVRHAAREAAESNVAERFAAQFELQRNTFLEKQSAMLDGSLPPRPRGRGRPSKADQKAAAIAATIAATNGGSTATPLSAGVSPSTGSKKRPSSHAHASDDSSHSSTESAENAAAVVVAAAAAAAKHGGNQRDADDDDEEEEEEDEEDDGREDDDDDDYEGADDEPVHAAKKAKKASSQAVVVPKPAPPKSQSKSQQRAVEPIKPDRHADADGIDEDDEEAHGGEEDEDEDEDEDGADGDDENQQQPANALTSFAKIATSRGVVHNATSAAAARIRRTESVDTMHLLCAFSETLEEDRKAPAAAESPKKTSMAPPIVVVTQPAAE